MSLTPYSLFMSVTPYSLQELLHPRLVAIIGASRALHKWGHLAQT